MGLTAETDVSPDNTSFEFNPIDMEVPDAGMMRRRLIPPEMPRRPSSGFDHLNDHLSGFDHHDGGCPATCACMGGRLLDRAESDLPLASPSTHTDDAWQQILKDLLLEQVFTEYCYQELVSYLRNLFKESCRLLRKCVHQTDSRLVSTSDHINAGLVPLTLRLLTTLGYRYESVDRIEAMAHVTLTVHGRMSLVTIAHMYELTNSLKCLSVVDARFLLMKSSDMAGTIIEVIEAASGNYLRDSPHYQSTLKALWDRGESDLLQSIGFSRRRPAFSKTYQYEQHWTEETDRRAQAVSLVLRRFHKPANTLV